jgi:alpha-ketoglutarate-dependent taurine dioxygenase
MLARPVATHIGAELTSTATNGLRLPGVDAGWLLEQLEQHLVIVARGQFLTHREQVALARSLGEPTAAHPVVPAHPDFPEILQLDGAQGGRNARWHTDVTFVVAPPMASILVAEAVPEFGGDTQWASLHAAYEALAPSLQTLVDGLEAVHRITPLAYWGEPFDTALGRDDAQKLWDQAASIPPVVHPVVRIHPATGRKALFVNPGFTSHIVGLSRLESEAILGLLYAHATQPEFVMRHRWQPGDVVMWDNRATMHYAVDDYGVVDRRMRRISLRGDVAVGPTGVTSYVPDDPLITIR